MGNIFITSLSTLLCPDRRKFPSMDNKEDIKINEYKSYNKEKPYKGLMTNEASTYYVIDELVEKGEKIDKIILICTDSVEKELELTDEVCLRILKEQIEPQENKDLTARNYYIASVIDFIKENKYSIYGEMKKNYEDDYLQSSIFQVVNIHDTPDEGEIYQCIVDVVNQIENGDELYIDINGGYRDVNAILLALCRVLRVMKPEVNIRHNIFIPFKRRKDQDDSVENNIVDRKFVFSMFDLISGIDEFSQYGSVKKLNDYYDGASGAVKQVLDAMNEVSESLKLCFSDRILNAFQSLKDAFSNYNKPEQEKNGIEKFLFDYVETSYSEFLADSNKDKVLIKIISWCVVHDMIQPALCLCVEKIPDYMETSHILYMDSDIKDELMLVSDKDRRNKEENDNPWYFIFTNVIKQFYEGKLYGKYLKSIIKERFKQNSSIKEDEFDKNYEIINKLNNDEKLKSYIRGALIIQDSLSRMKDEGESDENRRVEIFESFLSESGMDMEIYSDITVKLSLEDSAMLLKKRPNIDEIIDAGYDARKMRMPANNDGKAKQYCANINNSTICSKLDKDKLKNILVKYMEVKNIRNASFHNGKEDSKGLDEVKKDINALLNYLDV